jgi:hypothetical protein
MKESRRKDPTSHPDPESCVGRRKAAGEALTGAHAGPAIELRNQEVRSADAVNRGGRQHYLRRER